MCGVDEISSSLELHCGRPCEIMSLGKGWSLQEKFALGFWCLLLKISVLSEVCFGGCYRRLLKELY